MSPRGAVSIIMDESARSADIDTHTRTARLRIHHGALTVEGGFAHADETIDMADEPDHQELCQREQAWLYEAIVNDVDLQRHGEDAVQSLRICLAADESVRNGQPVSL